MPMPTCTVDYGYTLEVISVTMEIRWPVLPCVVKTVEGDLRFAGLPLQIWANSQRKTNPNWVRFFFMNDSHVWIFTNNTTEQFDWQSQYRNINKISPPRCDDDRDYFKEKNVFDMHTKCIQTHLNLCNKSHVLVSAVWTDWIIIKMKYTFISGLSV